MPPATKVTFIPISHVLWLQLWGIFMPGVMSSGLASGITTPLHPFPAFLHSCAPAISLTPSLGYFCFALPLPALFNPPPHMCRRFPSQSSPLMLSSFPALHILITMSSLCQTQTHTGAFISLSLPISAVTLTQIVGIIPVNACEGIQCQKYSTACVCLCLT